MQQILNFYFVLGIRQILRGLAGRCNRGNVLPSTSPFPLACFALYRCRRRKDFSLPGDQPEDRKVLALELPINFVFEVRSARRGAQPPEENSPSRQRACD